MRRLAFVRREPGQTSTLRKALLTALAIFLSLVVPALVIAGVGYNPWIAFKDLLWGALGGGYQIGSALVKFAPLLTAGIGVAIAFRSGLWNIGNLGQFLAGGLGAALAGLYFGSFPGAWLFGLIAGCLAGALWALLPGLLRVFWSINEVITTLMMNYIAIEITSYLVGGPWRDPQGTEAFTAHFAEGTILPIVLPGTRLHAGIVVAILAVIVMAWVLRNTVFGYQLTITGAQDEVARFNGMNTGRIILLTMFISGGLAGLAGVGEVAGVQHRVIEGFSSGYGYTAIAIAMLGGSNPIGVAISAFLFAALVIGANGMQDLVGVPVSLVFIIEGLVLLFVLGGEMFRRRRLLPGSSS